jgi:hypothetical protein
MNPHEQACIDCKIGIKAYQNIVGSLAAFDRFLILLRISAIADGRFRLMADGVSA